MLAAKNSTTHHPAELAEYESVDDLQNAEFANKGSNLTCITCRQLFSTAKDQKEHFKGDLHRFNLRRKVVNLPPVSEKVFEQKVRGSLQDDGNKPSKNLLKCDFCNKNFASDATYQTHLLSKKHIEAEKLGPRKKPEKKPSQETVGDAPKATDEIVIDNSDGQLTAEQVQYLQEKIQKSKVLTVEDCLFCNNHSSDLQSNLEHMTKIHGFFIPDIEYLKDLEGFMKYLADKVSIGNVCLYCNGKGKHFESLEAVQAHMRALSHCKLLYENNEAEYEDYYDFSTDYQEIDINNSSNVRISDDGSQLIFNNGRTVGHRNLAIYYRQKFKMPESRECIIVNKLMSEYRLLGWHENSQSHKTSTDYYTERRKQDFNYKIGVKLNNQKFHNSQNNIIA